MVKKKYKSSKRRYDLGGQILGGLGSGLSIASNAIKLAKGVDTTELENQAKNYGNVVIKASSSDDLLKAAQNRRALNHVTRKELTGGIGAEIFGTIGATASGALSGFTGGSVFDKKSIDLPSSTTGSSANNAAAPIVAPEVQSDYGTTLTAEDLEVDAHPKGLGGVLGGIVGGATNLVSGIVGMVNTGENLARLNNTIDAANARRDRAYSDAAQNFSNNQYNNLMANYAAFGGPIYGDYMMPITGPSSYDIMKDFAIAKQAKAAGQDTESLAPPVYGFADGGGIHIAPSKKGTFTAAATKHGKSVQAFASQVLANPDNYSPAMVKKANFAKNAAKWHADGGMLFSDSFTNGVTLVDQGGTHENNPHEGVQMGIAPDGKPNLVEEGEAVYNDYVFSNRLRVPKEVRNKYKLRGPKDMTFAEAFREAQKESKERPNDPISQDGLENIAMVLARTQEAVRGFERAKKGYKAALGGHLFSGLSESALRLIEPGANMFAVATDLGGITNNPYNYDYISPFQEVGFDPIGNYLPISHVDTRYAANQAAQQAAATKDAIMQSSSPNRNAALLASGYNSQIANGELLRQAASDDYNMMVKREELNRATNQANAEMGLRAAAANQDARLRYGQAALQQAKMNVDETNATMGAKAANLSALAESVANIGRESDAINWRDMLINAGVFGTLSEKPAGWTNAQWQAYQDAVAEAHQKGEVKALGGKIKRKKRGLTY